MSSYDPNAGIDVVVPVHGGWEHVERCLDSLEKQTVPISVIVVDDRSPDDTATRIEQKFPRLTLIRNSTNIGFAASCNRGIAAGSGRFVILLNSDVHAEPAMAESVAAAFSNAGADAGSVSPLLLQPNGLIDSFGITADVTLAGFVRLHGAEKRRARGQHSTIVGPYGALAAYRRVALDSVGLLDENIFMYGEELELAFRLANAGWRTIEINEPLGVHIGGASAGAGSARQRYLAGFGRGYILRVYDVFRSRHGFRALATELVVVTRGMLAHRDFAQLRGRFAGWRQGRNVAKRSQPVTQIDASISFVQSLKMRSPRYWKGTS
ncbi:glycosyltransferase family 2 protein [Microbacterium memoriense]|uniref:Glycosyltransferase family 2 protein n=1 Tax=Microbacterium memoriense TaxID=2978350 RepID=A0ABT2PB36_9MICO|nr:glycosyltransferase family 2 protein [Microbacterium memoriense]MCT9001819.1 glycosyltransferase family 2 protein [Microbacterium memoriense]